MRESKYRAWDKEDKRMIVDKQDFIPLIVTNLGVMKLDPTSKENRWILFPRERFVLMQSTGLTDKNGVEIYDGDVLLVDKSSMPFKVTVRWNNGLFGFDVITQHNNAMDLYMLGCDLEIISNIHDVSE